MVQKIKELRENTPIKSHSILWRNMYEFHNVKNNNVRKQNPPMMMLLFILNICYLRLNAINLEWRGIILDIITETCI